MIKKAIIASIISFAVFTLFFLTLRVIMRPLGSHDAISSKGQLRRLHAYIEMFEYRNDSLPNAEVFNTMIREHYQKSSEELILPDSNDEKFALFLICERISKDRNLHLWGAPPIYIQDKTLPEGYGFYLAGEDGISKSMGRDTDDVNSWDPKSGNFYYLRMREQQNRPLKYISIILALFTFIYIMTRKKKTFSSLRDSKA